MIWIYLHRESGSCLRLLFQLAEDPKSNKSPLRAAPGWFVIPFINPLTGNVSLIYTIDQPLKSFSSQYRNYWLFLVRLMWRFGAFYVFFCPEKRSLYAFVHSNCTGTFHCNFSNLVKCWNANFEAWMSLKQPLKFAALYLKGTTSPFLQFTIQDS